LKAIETHNLTKYYGRQPGIIDLNLEVEEGSIFGFIGPNGAGKSTTIRTLLNLIFPTRGGASVLGLDIIKQSRDIRGLIGYVPSEINYYGDMTVNNLLSYSASFYPGRSTRQISQLAERFDLEAGKRIDQLSFGNKRKVAIIQALLHHPQLLILDEPTSGLDPLMQNIFFELLREENQRATIVFSSHALDEVQKLCQQVAIIKQGRLIAVESVDKLRRTSFKKISLEYESDHTSSIELPGILNSQRVDSHHNFMFSGESKCLLQALAQAPVTNVLIEEPSLEEIFLHYYKSEDQ